MLTRRRAYRSTTEAFSLWQPGIIPADLQEYGIPIGYEQVTGRIVWLWLHNLNLEANYISIEGMKGSGKTTFMKSMVLRASCFQARGVMLDREFYRSKITSRKPNLGLAEYVPILDFLKSDITSMGSGDGFNIFSLFKTEAEVSVVAVFLAEHKHGTSLKAAHRIAILAGVHKMFAQNINPHPKRLENVLRTLSYADFNAFYEDDNSLVETVLEKEAEVFPGTIKDMSLQAQDLRDVRPDETKVANSETDVLFEDRHLQAAKEAADIFLDLVRGYKGIFSGEASLFDLLAHDIVGIDEYGMADGAAEIYESIINKGMANALSYAKSADDLILTKILPHASWSDEEGEAMNSVFHVRFKAQFVNKLRMVHTALVEAKQYHIQGDQVGDEGSDHRRYSQEVEFGVGAYIVFKQPNSAAYLRKYAERGMPDEYVKLLPKLHRGQAILYVPGKTPVRFYHQLLPSEIPLVQTMQASEQMNTHEPITETAVWEERMALQPDRIARLRQQSFAQV